MDERLYTIPLIKAKSVPRTKRAPRAIKEIRAFLVRHMKVENVKIDSSINELIWGRGREKIPSKVRVKAVKTEDIVWAYTPEAEVRIPEKKEKKKKKEKAEEKPEEVIEEEEIVPEEEEVEEVDESIPSEAWTKNQLLEYAKERGIPVNQKMRKADILAAVLSTTEKETGEISEEADVKEEEISPEAQPEEEGGKEESSEESAEVSEEESTSEKTEEEPSEEEGEEKKEKPEP